MSDLFKGYYSKFKFNEVKQKLSICIVDGRNINDINLNEVEI